MQKFIAVVIFGIGITLPVFLIGSELAVALGFKDYFLPFVFFLGIATTPIAGIYFATISTIPAVDGL